MINPKTSEVLDVIKENLGYNLGPNYVKRREALDGLTMAEAKELRLYAWQEKQAAEKAVQQWALVMEAIDKGLK